MKTKILVGLLLFNSAIYATEYEYSISMLGEIEPNTTYHPTSINDLGQVVGSYSPVCDPDTQNCNATNVKAFISSEINNQRSLTEIKMLHDNFSLSAINNSGIVVGSGSRTDSSSTIHAFVTQFSNGEWITKDIFPDATTSTYALDINNANQIIGFTVLGSMNAYSTFVATYDNNEITIDSLFTAENMPNPPFPDYGRSPRGKVINDLGEIAGNTTRSYPVIGNTPHGEAFTASKEGTEWKIVQLEEPDSPNITISRPSAMNTSNQIVGNSQTDRPRRGRGHLLQSNAFISTPLDDKWSLDFLEKSAEANNTYASDINKAGLIVGSEQKVTVILEERRPPKYEFLAKNAIIYDLDRKIHNLFGFVSTNAEGWSSLKTATAINEKNQIVGVGTYNGKSTPYILTPVTTVTPPSSEQAICETGVDPQTIKKGEGTALWWWSDAVTSANIDNNIGSVSVPSDYKWIYPTETTTYTMTAKGADGTATTCNATVTVDGQFAAPPVCEMGADPQVIQAGEGTALWWWTDNIASASINNDKGLISAPSDYIWFYPAQTTTYKMYAVGENGEKTDCETTITVEN
jgi:hypothetical protein